MDNQVNRKRRTGQLCSKKEILLSRSLATEDSAKRNSSEEILFVHVVSDGKKADSSKYIPSLLSYTEQDRLHDEDILRRFDIGFNRQQEEAKKAKNTTEQTRRSSEDKKKEENNRVPSEEVEPEIIDLESISTNNHNTRLLSSEISSDFAVSASSKSSPRRHRIKNTIPGDNFERYLASLAKERMPMTYLDRVTFWNFSPDKSETEINDYPDKLISLEPFPEQKRILNISSENNNDKPYWSVSISTLETEPNTENEILFTINTSTKEMIKSDQLDAVENSKSVWNEQDSDFKKITMNREIDRPIRKSYGNSREIQDKADSNDSTESIFKVPNIPINAAKYLANKMDTSRKEEFYKYLGLGTICPNGQHGIIVKRDKKRRSLRVQRLQKQHDNKKVKKDDVVGVQQGSTSSDDDDTNCNLGSPTENSEAQSKNVNGFKFNLKNEPYQNQMIDKSIQSSISHSILRRTCGSIVPPISGKSSKNLSTKITSIIEKVDYTSVKSSPSSLTTPPYKTNDTTSRNPSDNHSFPDESLETYNGDLRIHTRLSRKNGLTNNSEELTELGKGTESCNSPKSDNLERYFINVRLHESQHSSTISCIDRVSYKNDEENFDTTDKMDQSTDIVEDIDLNTEPKNTFDFSMETTDVDVQSEADTTIDSPKSFDEEDSSVKAVSPTRSSTEKLRKRKRIKCRTVLRSTRLNQTILRSKKILKIMTAKLRIKKIGKQKTVKTVDECDAKNEIILSVSETENSDIASTAADMLTIEPVALPAQEELRISPILLPAAESFQPEAENQAPNLLPNPLEKSAGPVLHAFYEQDFLIVVQELKISFWKYSKVIKMFAQPQNWEMLGEHERKLNDMEILAPYKNRLCINETNPVYVEMRARQFIEDVARECNVASVYVNVYYFDEWKAAIVLHAVHLDNVCGLFVDISYTTITNSRYFIMCWKQDSISNVTRTGLCKYSLTPDLNSLASIREFQNMRHTILQLECLNDNKLIGFGETEVTIWDHMTGDVLTNFDFETSIGQNLGSVYSSIEFKNYLILYQKRHDTTKGPQLIILVVNLSENPQKFRLIYTHDLSSSFLTIKSSLSTNDLVITTSEDGCELLLLLQQPHRIFYCNNYGKVKVERFCSSGSQNFVEISEENLIVKTINEFLMDFVK